MTRISIRTLRLVLPQKASLRSFMPGMILAAILVLTVFRPAEAADVSGAVHGKIPAVITGPDRAALVQAAKSPGAGILLTDDQGQALFSQNPDTPMVPASILKILTSLAALEHWGEEYRFTTQAAWDADTLTLHIRGMGDPLFVSEAIQGFCRQLVEKIGMQQLDTIAIDQSYFAPNLRVPGTGRTLNPYDATTGALCANFNTLNFTRDSSTGQIRSAEPQTPLLEQFLPAIRRTGLSQGRILLDESIQPIYPGLLMAYFFRELGVTVTGNVETGPFPDLTSGGNPLLERFVLASPWPLESLVKKLLQFSNNFIANQVMLALGAHVSGPPATLDKGIQVLTQTAAGLPGWDTATIAEGSGISRENRVTPAQMGTLLMAFMPFHTLMPFTGSQYYKTGTLTGIRTRAGYFIGTDHRLYPFVIMQ